MKRRDFLQQSIILTSLSVPALVRGQTKPCPPVVDGASGTQPACGNTQGSDAEADWILRSRGTGVVWFHDFSNKAEVDNFRWTPAEGNGNDPGAKGNNAHFVSWEATNELTGGGCLAMHRDAGTAEGAVWSRPFSAMSGSSNGRGQNDPAANGTMTLRSYSPTQGGGQLSNFAQGYFGHADYHDSSFEGNEFYLQFRVKRDFSRGSSPTVGKFVNLGAAGNPSPGNDTLVTYSALPNFRAYAYWDGSGATPLDQQGNGDGTIQPGGVSEIWKFEDGGWDTLMFHIVPGHVDVQDTLFEVYAAHEGETQFKKIWSDTYLIDSFLDKEGIQAVTMSVYQNGQSASAWTDRFKQIILSKEFIPCPQV